VLVLRRRPFVASFGKVLRAVVSCGHHAIVIVMTIQIIICSLLLLIDTIKDWPFIFAGQIVRIPDEFVFLFVGVP